MLSLQSFLRGRVVGLCWANQNLKDLKAWRTGGSQRSERAQEAGTSSVRSGTGTLLGPACSGVTLNVARPDMNNYATSGVMLY